MEQENKPIDLPMEKVALALGNKEIQILLLERQLELIQQQCQCKKEMIPDPGEVK